MQLFLNIFYGGGRERKCVESHKFVGIRAVPNWVIKRKINYKLL